jgi:Tfp pilus assembly protein PilO
MKQTTKRFASMIIGLLFLVGALLIYFYLIQGEYESSQNLKAKLNSKQDFLDKEKNTVLQVQKLIDSYKQSQNQQNPQAGISLALPTSQDVAGATAQLSGLAQQSASNLQSITVSILPAQVAKSAAAKKGVATEGNFQDTLQKPLGTISFALKLTGGYESIKSFISLLETNLRIFDLRSFTITPVAVKESVSPLRGETTPGASIFTYEVGVNTYYQNP